MNLLRAYSRLPMSLANLYRRRGVRGHSTIAVALAMSELLIVNVWSLLWFCIAFLEPDLKTSRALAPTPLIVFMFGVFLAELGFVSYVERRVHRDACFAASVQAAKPAIWIWYSVISCALLGAAIVAVAL